MTWLARLGSVVKVRYSICTTEDVRCLWQFSMTDTQRKEWGALNIALVVSFYVGKSNFWFLSFMKCLRWSFVPSTGKSNLYLQFVRDYHHEVGKKRVEILAVVMATWEEIHTSCTVSTFMCQLQGWAGPARDMWLDGPEFEPRWGGRDFPARDMWLDSPEFEPRWGGARFSSPRHVAGQSGVWTPMAGGEIFQPETCGWTVRSLNPDGGGQDFPDQSRPAPRPTQRPVQRILGLFPRGRAAGAWRWPPTPLWCQGRVSSYISPPLCASMASKGGRPFCEMGLHLTTKEHAPSCPLSVCHSDFTVAASIIGWRQGKQRHETTER
jgi:hypothetical protein